jgi:hypothetical protein
MAMVWNNIDLNHGAAPRYALANASMERVQFEMLLSDISAQLIATNPEQVQETIELALDAVRQFFDAECFPSATRSTP